MRRIFTVDPTGRDERVMLEYGRTYDCVEVIVSAGLLTLETVIKTAAVRGGLDQLMNGRLRHV